VTTLILRQVSQIMAFGKHPPHLRPEVERVWEHLEYDVAIVGTIATAPQGGQAQCVGGVVREVETSFKGDACAPGILQTKEPGPPEAIDLSVVGRLGAQWLARTAQSLKR
jgi:hypothetical protein